VTRHGATKAFITAHEKTGPKPTCGSDPVNLIAFSQRDYFASTFLSVFFFFFIDDHKTPCDRRRGRPDDLK